ncbi:membrane protein insertion efficiency factor YidD [Candidatus Gracilibacteria bacterium]|nr:membrane protein insertion efficiency factor YidD [Candidatus Gracilibacteria bacterium]
MLKKILISVIISYQKYLSPDHSIWAKAMNRPPYCKHIPSCSDYTIEALEKKGVILGTLKGIWRILRCNPWSKGGYDPVERAQKTPNSVKR